VKNKICYKKKWLLRMLKNLYEKVLTDQQNDITHSQQLVLHKINQDQVILQNKKELFFKIPLNNDVEFTLTFTNDDKDDSTGYVGLGKLVVGRIRAIGTTLLNPNVNLMTTTIKTRDESGFSYYDKRNTFKDVSYEVLINNNLRDITYRLFESIDGIDCVFAPTLNDENMSIVSYGSYSDFSLSLDHKTKSTYSITVEGVI